MVNATNLEPLLSKADVKVQFLRFRYFFYFRNFAIEICSLYHCYQKTVLAVGRNGKEIYSRARYSHVDSQRGFHSIVNIHALFCRFFRQLSKKHSSSMVNNEISLDHTIQSWRTRSVASAA